MCRGHAASALGTDLGSSAVRPATSRAVLGKPDDLGFPTSPGGQAEVSESQGQLTVFTFFPGCAYVARRACLRAGSPGVKGRSRVTPAPEPTAETWACSTGRSAGEPSGPSLQPIPSVEILPEDPTLARDLRGFQLQALVFTPRRILLRPTQSKAEYKVQAIPSRHQAATSHMAPAFQDSP